MFLEGTKEMQFVHNNKPPSKQVEHIVVDAIVNDYELVKNVNRLSLKERPTEDVEGDEFTSNSSLEKNFLHHKMRVYINHNKMDKA